MGGLPASSGPPEIGLYYPSCWTNSVGALHGRVGMGPCQGRYCGLTVAEILARSHNMAQSDIGAYRIRMPLKPVTLGELSALDAQDAAE